MWPPVIVSQVGAEWSAKLPQLRGAGERDRHGVPETHLIWIRPGQGRGWFQILVFSLQRYVLYPMDHAGMRAVVLPTAWTH